jgi:RNA polymerase sigma factor for flagellar operon FliA
MPVPAIDAPAGRTGPQSELTNQLWAHYRATGDSVTRSHLLEGYLGLVHHFARELFHYAPPDVELDDLIGAGTLGLIQSLETFDPGRGVAFSSFAVPRIRGAIFDDLRNRDWLPRTAKTHARDLSRAEAKLQQGLGRAPEPAEVAAELGLTMEAYWRWREDRDGRTFVGFDSTVSLDGSHTASVAETIPDRAGDNPPERLTRAEALHELREAMGALPAKERLVLALSFYEEATLRQIGEVLHVSESRVSQIRTQALQRLRTVLSLAAEDA